MKSSGGGDRHKTLRTTEVMDRRQFVRTSGGLLISASLAAACDASTGLAPTGTVHVVIIGLGSGVVNGGTAVVTRTDVAGSTPLNVTIDASGSGTVTVPAGTYHAVYTAPTGYQALTANDLTVTVPAGGTTNVSVTVGLIVVQGTLRVAVSGLTGAAANGGSASLLRTDVSGQTPVTVPISLLSPLVDTVVAVGTYTVTYTAPSGFTVVGGVSKSVVVTTGATTLAAFVVALAGAAAGDLYEFGFEDGTGGLFVNTSAQPFLTAAGTHWVLDATTPAARGTKSVSQTYPASAGNVGGAFLFNIATPRTDVYVRAMYRQSNPFNKNGSTNNYDQIKLLRMQGPGITGQLASIFISNSLNSAPGVVLGTFADLEGNVQHAPNVNLPQPTMNDLLGQWVCIEGHWDITVNNALHFECWINGVQSHDYTIAQPNLGKTYAWVQFDGTINSMQQDSTAWFDQIGIGTHRMGLPA